MLECPLCNQLINIYQVCPKCHQPVVDGGSLGNYVGPYSPYEEGGLEWGESVHSCTHLIYCPSCGEDWPVEIGMVSMR
ncbi:MAG: hypothetical protein HPY50_09145 [Firmicutes bacterium]|nr:hypothetical protein [Bacillota bacterium]